MGIVLGVLAIGDVFAAMLVAAGAVAATITEVAAGVIAALLPELDFAALGGLANIALDTGEDVGIDEVLASGAKSTARALAKKMVATFEEKDVKLTYSNILKVCEKSYGKGYSDAEGAVKAVKYAHTASEAARKVCCLHPECVAAGGFALSCDNDTTARRLDEGVPSAKWKSLDSIGANTEIVFPLQQLCGGQVTNVSNLAQAQTCYADTLSTLQLKMDMSSSWRDISQFECKIVLFGATDDPNDEYCTVFRVPFSGATDGTFNYTEVPHCKDMETATLSMILASKTVPPRGLKPFVWAPTHTCELEHPGVRTTNMLPRIPAPHTTDDVPTLAILVGIAVVLVTIGSATLYMHRHTHALLQKLNKAARSTQEETAVPMMSMSTSTWT